MNSARRIVFVVLSLYGILASAACLHAEDISTAGVLQGTVLFENIGIPVIDANISLSPGWYFATTDDSGRYELPSVEPGTYTMSVEAFGMMPYVITDVSIIAGETTDLDITTPADRKFIRWRFPHGYSASLDRFAIDDDGTIYAGSFDGRLYTLSSGGDSLGITETEGAITAPVLNEMGILYGSGDTVHMFDRFGMELWTYTAGGTVHTPVLAPNGSVYFCCDDGGIYALDASGSRMWITNLPYDSFLQPVIGMDGTIYISTYRMLVALDRYGAEKWTYVSPDNIFGPPAMDGEGRLFLCTENAFTVLDQAGQEQWSFQVNNISTAPVVDEKGIAYFGAREAVCAVLDNHLVWQYSMTDQETVVRTPVIGSDGFVYFGTSAGNVRALTSEGYLTWRYHIPDSQARYFKLTSDGVLHFTTGEGRLYGVQTRSYGYPSGASWPCDGKNNRNAAYTVPGEGMARITGTVRSEADNSPIRGIALKASPGNSVSMTDSHGFYELYVPVQGVYEIEAFSPGMLPQTRSGIEPDSDTVDFMMTRGDVWTKWRTYIGDPPGVYRRSAPAVDDDGVVYITASGWLTAISPEGEIMWRTTSGHKASPLIADSNTVYSMDDETLAAYNTMNGEQEWSFMVISRYGKLTAPALAADGTIFIGNEDRNDKAIRAVIPSDSVKWTCEVEDPIISPAIVGNDGTIYIGGERGLHALHPTGEEKWLYDTVFDNVTAPPVVGPDHTIYCVQKVGIIHAINPDGSSKWTYTTERTATASPVIAPDNTLYYIDGTGCLFAINSDGTLDWKLDGFIQETTPVLDADGIIYAAKSDGSINAVLDGGVLWSFPVGSSPAYDIKLTPDGTLIAYCIDGYLYAIQTKSPGYPSTYCWPCLYGNNRNTNRVISNCTSGTIAGVIQDKKTRNGIVNALVTLEPSGITASTDNYGLFMIHDVEPGTYTLTTSAFGYIQEEKRRISIPAEGETIITMQLDQESFRLKWTFDTFRHDGRVQFGNAIKYSAALGDEGTLYVVNGKTLFAVKPAGYELWSADLVDEGKEVSIAADGSIYVTIWRGVQAFSPDGIEIWNFPTSGESEGAISIDPRGRVYLNTQSSKMYCLDPAGALLWEVATGHIGNTPAIAYDGTVYASTNLNSFMALSPEGEVLWTSPARGIPPSLGTDGTIYAMDWISRRKVKAMSPKGEELWSYQADGIIETSCAVSANKTIYFGDQAGMLHAIDSTGNMIWKYQANDSIQSTPAIGSDGVIYFGDRSGMFYALNQDGTPLWTFQTGGDIWGSPAIAADGTVYIGSYDSMIYAFQTNSYGYQEGAPWPCYCHDSQRTSYMDEPPIVGVGTAELPESLTLSPIRPNPFNSTATIPFALPSDGNISIIIYNIAGQRVRTLIDAPVSAGYHQAIWDGRDDAGKIMATGVFIVQIMAIDKVKTEKMLLVK